MDYVSIANLYKSFEGAEHSVPALQDINLKLSQGEFVCLLGPSGCGKSTLLNSIAGFITPTSGEIIVDGHPIKEPGPDRGVVFQEYAIFPWMTVARNIAFGLEIKGVSLKEIQERVDSLLDTFGLREFRDRFPKDLSGGMRQRVAIARLLAIDSPFMLMDEPFGALDALTRRTLQDELLRIWSKSGKTILFVTHSIEESLYLANRIIVMTYRPGTIKRNQIVTMPYPRDPAGREFNEMKRELGLMVMEEQERHTHDEIGSK
ncbi:MAG: ABC transporter ATP-binding protein [Desulfuromonadales bacterium]